MKVFIAGMLVLASVSSFAGVSELQLHECSFKGTRMEFTPSAALTGLLKQEVKGAVVYKVQYKKGSTAVGPRTDLAVIDKLPSKSLAITFFEHDEEDGIVYSQNRVSIDLKSPVSVDAPVIVFESELNDEDGTEGKCSL